MTERRLPLRLKGPEEKVLDRRWVFVLRVEPAVGWDTTDIDPVGCAVARAVEAPGLAEGLARDGPDGTATLPVIRESTLKGSAQVRGGARASNAGSSSARD